MVGLGLGFRVRVRVRRPDSSGNLLLRRKLHLARSRVSKAEALILASGGNVIRPRLRRASRIIPYHEYSSQQHSIIIECNIIKFTNKFYCPTTILSMIQRGESHSTARIQVSKKRSLGTQVKSKPKCLPFLSPNQRHQTQSTDGNWQLFGKCHDDCHL